MKVIINDRNQHTVQTFGEVLSQDFPNWTYRCQNFEDIPTEDYDWLMTPGNSYGQMTGGFDLAVRNKFPYIEQAVQEEIKHKHHGMLPVGNYVLVSMYNTLLPVQGLIYTPTMRIPMPINGENVYWAYRAGLRVAMTFSESAQLAGKELRVLIPPFGTSAGQLPAFKAANMLKLAYRHLTRDLINPAATQNMFADHHEIMKWV